RPGRRATRSSSGRAPGPACGRRRCRRGAGRATPPPATRSPRWRSSDRASRGLPRGAGTARPPGGLRVHGDRRKSKGPPGRSGIRGDASSLEANRIASSLGLDDDRARSDPPAPCRAAKLAVTPRPSPLIRIMATVVIDIETTGASWDSFDDAQRTYLLRNARSEEERERMPEMLSLWPFTGKIIAVAMLNTDSRRGRVWYEKNDGREEEVSEDRLFTFIGDTEPVFLTEFWKAMRRFQRFVTFNGRTFDGPFLMLRSAALGVTVTRNLVGYRYAIRPHTDLLEVISFFGATRKWNLDFACKAFGVESPKEQGMDGYSVGPYYRAGRVREIALYCRRDVEATARLYGKMEKTLLPALETR